MSRSSSLSSNAYHLNSVGWFHDTLSFGFRFLYVGCFLAHGSSEFLGAVSRIILYQGEGTQGNKSLIEKSHPPFDKLIKFINWDFYVFISDQVHVAII